MKKLIVAKSAGFCFGVQRAVEMARNALKSAAPCYCVGQIIHNEAVVRELESKGMRTVSSACEIPQGARVIVRSHGISRQEYRLLEDKEAEIIDATCPKVSKIHKIVAQADARGRLPVIIGSENHPEVRAIRGWCENSLVFSGPDEISVWAAENRKFEQKPLTVIFQTTQIKENVNKCGNILKNIYTNLEFFDTICLATSIRQQEARCISSECDGMVVIGDKHSANSVHLAEICKKHCKSVYFIESADELPAGVFKFAQTVGITAGASAPAWIIKEVKQKMVDENRMEDMTIIDSPETSAEQAAVTEISVNDATEDNMAAQTVPEAQTDSDFVESAAPPDESSVDQNAEKSFAEMVEDTIKTIANGERVTGIVAAITPTEVSVDLGTKHSGYIPLSEFTDDPEMSIESIIQIGSKIEACVVRVNDVEGTVMLSKKRLDAIKNWNDIEVAQTEGTVVEGVVIEENKGGVVVSVGGVRVFVPASQTGLAKDTPMSEMLKQRVRLKITEVNRSRRRVVGSVRAIQYKERKERSERIWNEIETGKTYDGVVKSLTSYGAFVDIGGIDGMVHVSEMSWSRIKQPSEVLSVGDKITVHVLGFDRESKKISLGYRDPEANPWIKFINSHNVGDRINVKIVKLMPFGAFAEVLPGVDGLIHISQISDRRIGKPDEILTVGEYVDSKIIGIDEEKKKISLSIRALSEPEPITRQEAQAEGEEGTANFPQHEEDALVFEVSEAGESKGIIPEAGNE